MRIRCSRGRRALLVATLVSACCASLWGGSRHALADPSVAVFKEALDLKGGGLKGGERFLDRSAGELAVLLAARGDKEAQGWIERTLDEAQVLGDSAHGGFYSRALGATWSRPLGEKTLEAQATAIRLYALGFFLLDHESLLKTAEAVQTFVESSLKIGEGRYARAASARDTGLDLTFSRIGHAELVQALSTLYAATSRQEFVELAFRVAEVSLKGESDSLSLAEVVAVTDSYLALYAVSAQRRWLDEACGLMKVARKRFSLRAQEKIADLTLLLQYIRVAGSLGGYVRDDSLRRDASAALRSLSIPQHASPSLVSLYFLAHAELDSEPTHFMTVGDRDDAQSRTLWRETLRVIPLHLQREWIDPKEVRARSYPRVSKPAVFVCSKGRCSLPLFTEQEVRETIARVVP